MHHHDDAPWQLPPKPVDRVTRIFVRFLHIEALAGGILLACSVVALILSNSDWADDYLAFWEQPVGFAFGDFTVSHSLKHWVNDGLMTLFFFLVALELKREIVLGELRHISRAALSLAGALGGMAIPAAIFLSLEWGQEGANGWGTVMATDMAFVIGCLALLGSRIPQSLRLFLLSLAIFDDIGAILIIAFGYGSGLDLTALAIAGGLLVVIGGVAYFGVRSIPLYFALGAVLWFVLDGSGIHPTIAGVALGLMAPARSWIDHLRLQAILMRVVDHPAISPENSDPLDRDDLYRANVASLEAMSPIERLEMALHPWVAYGVVPVFALANAGVRLIPLEVDSGLTTAIFVGFVVGKPVGVLLFSYVAVKLGWATLPPEISWRVLFAGAMLTGIGFTMALLIAELAFDSSLMTSAKLGILSASIVSATLGLLFLYLFTSRGLPAEIDEE
jgi:Na+:H+ antiporter, NhaA family